MNTFRHENLTNQKEDAGAHVLTECTDLWKEQRQLQVIQSMKYEDISFRMIAVS
jgi:hypothetical protein